MRKIFLASHGSLAEGMLSAAKMILGTCGQISAYGLDTYGDPQKVFHLIMDQVKSEPENSFLILCDIKGGSVHNRLLNLAAEPNVCLITGMNLSLVLELATAPPEADLETAVDSAVEIARGSIVFHNREFLLEMNRQAEQEADELW